MLHSYAPISLTPTHTVTEHINPLVACALSADGSVALCPTVQRSVTLWDTRSGAPRTVLQRPTDPVWGCALSADGRVAATANFHGGVCVWDTLSGAELWELRRPGMDGAFDCALTPDGRTLVACLWNDSSGEVVRCDVQARRVLSVWRMAGAEPSDCAVAYNDSVVLVAVHYRAGGGEVRALDGRTGKLIRGWGCTRNAKLAMDGLGDRVVISDRQKLVVCRVRGDEKPRLMLGAQGSHHCSITADGARVLSPCADNAFGIWDASTGALLASLDAHTEAVCGNAISANGMVAVTCGLDQTVRFWNLRKLGTMTRPTTPEDIALREETARFVFRRVQAQDGSSSLTYYQAYREILALLARDGFHGGLAPYSEVETILENADTNSNERLSEDEFVNCFEDVARNFLFSRPRLSHLWEEAFENAAGSLSGTLSGRQAVRIIVKIGNSGEGDDFQREQATGTIDESYGIVADEATVLNMFSRRGILRETIGLEMFLQVAGDVMYGIDRSTLSGGRQSPGMSVHVSSPSRSRVGPSGGERSDGTQGSSESAVRSKAPSCIICMTADVNCAIAPCGHAYYCETCAKRIWETRGTCAVCQNSILDLQKIYL